MKKSDRRVKTEHNIIKAVETLLLNEGFASVGINAIARTAQCDKVLIYRYFGDLNGLLKQFASQYDLWWTIEDLIVSTPDPGLSLSAFLNCLLQKHIEEIKQRPLTQEIMAWELSDHNELTIALARIRAENGMLLVKKIRSLYQNPSIDIGGILGIFGASINYLIIRTRNLPLEHAKEEWWRFEQSLENLLKSIDQ